MKELISFILFVIFSILLSIFSLKKYIDKHNISKAINEEFERKYKHIIPSFPSEDDKKEIREAILKKYER